MSERILVHMTSGDDCIGLRTVSRSRKSPHWFYILRRELTGLRHNQETIVRDIYLFAALRRDAHAGTLAVKFTWLDSCGNGVAGYQEIVTLPYNRLASFLDDSALGGPKEWKTLSINDSRKRPKIAFKSRKNLHAALENPAVRKKLVRCLRDQFDWPYTDSVEIYDDFLPYSFGFREIRNGKPAVTGGLILHGQENLQNSYYAIHT